jgi:hypothetical protein
MSMIDQQELKAATETIAKALHEQGNLGLGRTVEIEGCLYLVQCTRKEKLQTPLPPEKQAAVVKKYHEHRIRH